MAIKNIVETQINVTGQNTVKQAADAYEDLGDAVSKTQLDAEKLAQQFGINDKRTQEAIKVAGKYKQEMEELDFAIDAARGGSDQLFRAAQGVTAGFEIAAGAVGLFGGQSEELEKVMLKVQGAMVFSQGLKDLQEFGPALLNLAGTVKGKVVTAFTTLRGAIIATGIGALTVAVGLLIAKWDSFTNYLSNSFPTLTKAAKYIADIAQKVTDYVGVTSKAERTQDQVNQSIQRNIDATGKKIKIAQAEGKQDKALNLQKQKSATELALARRKYAQEATKDNKKALADAKINFKLAKIAQKNFINDQKEAQRKANQDARLERQRAAKQKAEDDKRQSDEEFNAWLAQEMARYEYDEKLKKEAQEKEDKEYEAWLAQELANYEYRKKLEDQEAAEKKKRKDEEIAKEKAVQEAKDAIFTESQNLATALTALVGEQTMAGKALALGQIAADTARALSGALANANSPTPDNVASGGLAGIAKYISLAATIATNAKRAIDIVKSENVSQGAASGSAPTTGGGFTGSLNAPAVRLPRTEEFTGDRRVYVTEYDISNTQEKVKVTEDVSIVK